MIVPVKTDTWNYDIVLEPGAIKNAGPPTPLGC